MKAKMVLNSFFFISLNKLSLCVFDGIENEIFKSEILISEKNKNENLDNFHEKFFGDNILKVEKKINNFINEIDLVIHDSNFLQIQVSIKKDGKGDKINKHDLKNFQIISCPGCYPTSILLPLIPLIKTKLVRPSNIIIDSKSGYSGAGRGVHKRYINKNVLNKLL